LIFETTIVFKYVFPPFVVVQTVVVVVKSRGFLHRLNNNKWHKLILFYFVCQINFISLSTMSPVASKLVTAPAAGKKKARKPPRKVTTAVVEGTATGAGSVEAETEETDVKSSINKKRTQNYNHTEDYLLSKAWVAISADPVKGCNQKGHEFWAAVLNHYEYLQEKEEATLDADISCKRGWLQLQVRFNRHVQPLMNKFNKHYRWAYYNLPSGTPKTVDNYIKLGKESFFAEYKFHFKMEMCVPILHKSPRFDAFIAAIDVDAAGPPGAGAGVVTPAKKNNVGAGVMGGSLERPMGCKAAKAQKRQSEGTERELSLMRQEISSMGKTIEKRSAVADLARLAKSQRQDGDLDMARETTKKMKDLIERNNGIRIDDVTTTTQQTLSSTSGPSDVGVDESQVEESQVLLDEADDDDEEEDEETIIPSQQLLPSKKRKDIMEEDITPYASSAEESSPLPPPKLTDTQIESQALAGMPEVDSQILLDLYKTARREERKKERKETMEAVERARSLILSRNSSTLTPTIRK
jgi:hypothetical protein